MGGNKDKHETAPALQVDATASSGRRALDEFDSIPQTTCFGLRRKRAQKPRSAILKQDLANTAPSPSLSPRAVEREKVGDRLCGAGVFLRTFSSAASDSAPSEASISTRKGSGLSKLERAKEEPSQSAKILASYENLHGSSKDAEGAQSSRAADEERDGDRDDGADSLEDEEDTFDVPPWIVDPHDIYFVSRCDGTGKVVRLGKGDFGPVYMGVWKDQEVAVKLARQKPISLKQERNFQHQAAKLYYLEHPNLVRFLGACCWKGGKRSVIVMEYMDKSDLRSLLAQNELITKFAWVQHGRAVGLDIAKGLAYLHSQGIVHGRLKSSNVLMNKAGVAKVSDPHLHLLLSHCRDLSVERSAPIGSRAPAHGPHSAPEVLSGSEPTPAADVYAFGVILWELLSLEKPEGELRPIRTPQEAPAKIAYLVECCLAKEPAARPTADRIVAVLAGRP